MIWLTRLNGQEFALNADLIECVESTPDTLITLIDGRKCVVHESAQEVVSRVVQFRSSIVLAARGEIPPGRGDAAVRLIESRKRSD